MEIELEEIRRSRDILERVGSAGGGAETRRELETLSKEQESVLHELMDLHESDWRSLRGKLEEFDPELSAIVQSARSGIRSMVEEEEQDEPFRVSSRIQSMEAFPYLSLQYGVSFIRVTFKSADGKSFSSDQDLEDSLWVGMAVLQSVADSARKMVEELGIPPERVVWGDEFEGRLALAEESVRTLRRLYGGHREKDWDAVSSTGSE